MRCVIRDESSWGGSVRGRHVGREKVGEAVPTENGMEVWGQKEGRKLKKKKNGHTHRRLRFLEEGRI